MLGKALGTIRDSRNRIETLVKRILNFSEERKYLYHLKESPDDIELRIGLMSLYTRGERYDKALEQYSIIKQCNYNGKRKSELESNLKILQPTKMFS